MEQQVNINVYRVYVERPPELTGANLTEILLCGATNKSSVGIIEKTAPKSPIKYWILTVSICI